MLVPNIRSRAPSSPREQLFETGAAELEVVLAAVEREEAAAQQQTVAGEGVGGAQGQLVDGVGAEVFELAGAEGGGVKLCHQSMRGMVGGEGRVLGAPGMSWLWALVAIYGMI